METFIVIGILVGLVAYIIDVFMKPEKHIIGLVIFAFLYGIFGSFFDTTGAKADYDRKKRG